MTVWNLQLDENTQVRSYNHKYTHKHNLNKPSNVRIFGAKILNLDSASENISIYIYIIKTHEFATSHFLEKVITKPQTLASYI